MYDISELEIKGKDMAVAVLIVVILLVAVFCAGYMLGLRNVSDHGGGADAVGNQLADTGTAVQHAKDGIDAASGTADKIGAVFGDDKESAGYLQHTANTSAELIEQCQSIIERVRARGKK